MSERINMSSEQYEAMETLPAPVYYIESPNDDTVLVGINVEIRRNAEDDASVSWFDTTHVRTMRATELTKKDDFFAFRRADEDGGGEYYFQPMNVAIYEAKIKDKLVDGGDYDNDDELIKAFLETAEY